MVKKIFIFILFSILFITGKSQIYDAHNFYTQNLFYYSPAHTGDKEQIAAFINYRKHLVNIEDASKNAAFGIHSPITKKMNLGGLIKTQNYGLIETLSGRLDYSFRTPIAKHHNIALGINGGAMQKNLNINAVKVYNTDVLDPTLNPNYYKKNIFFMGASLSYVFKNIEFDLGIPFLYKNSGSSINGSYLISNYWSFLSYSIFSKSKTWKIQPSVSVNAYSDKFINYQVNLFLDYKNLIWIQPSYKIKDNITAKTGDLSVSVGVNFKKFGIAYAYETNSGGLALIGGPSHEIMISYGLFKNRINPLDTLSPEYKHNIKSKIDDKTYEEFVSSNNYGFYNNIIELTDSIYKAELIKKDPNYKAKQDSLRKLKIEKIKLDSLERIKQDSIKQAAIEQAKRDSIRNYNLRHLSDSEMKILEKGVHFQKSSAMINKESRDYLNEVAKLLKANKKVKILITGHTCDLGSDEINQKFSADRAGAVSYYLISKGVKAEQISTDLKLDAEPIVPNTNEENRKLNRRVSFSVITE